MQHSSTSYPKKRVTTTLLNLRHQYVRKKIIQTKLIMIADEDKNLPFGDLMDDTYPQETRILFINTNGLDIGTYIHCLNELCTNSKSQQFNILMLAKTNTHW